MYREGSAILCDMIGDTFLEAKIVGLSFYVEVPLSVCSCFLMTKMSFTKKKLRCSTLKLYIHILYVTLHS